MNRWLLLLLVSGFCLNCQPPATESFDPDASLEAKEAPAEWFFLQRSYPDTVFPVAAFKKALAEAKTSAGARFTLPGFNQQWTSVGPANIGARVNTLAVHPQDPDVAFAGYSSGGLYRTQDGGRNWEPLFTDAPYLAIGDVAIDPKKPNVVYAGTGDPNITIHPFLGNGVYRSADGGDSWINIGLGETGIISEILIHPYHPDTLYAGTMGLPFERGRDRGLYRSYDGGNSWEQVLFVSGQAGVIDVVMDPTNPQIIYAATWDRIRSNRESIVSGPNGAVYKTTDGGNTWSRLGGGLPTGNVGRIGLDIAQADPKTLVAVVVAPDNELDNVYRTEDGGATWRPLVDCENGSGFLPCFALGGFGWYFGKIRLNPENDEDIFLLGVELWRTRNLGETWELAAPPATSYEVHFDKHDMVFHPSGIWYLATDGGVYRSFDFANSWQDFERIAACQFYRVAYNPHEPENYFGGTQDNGTLFGSSLEDNWTRIFGGDGFRPVFHPTNPDIFYVETQNGGIRYTDNGGARFITGTNGIPVSDRRNWDTPYQMSPHNPNVLHAGTFRMFRSDVDGPPRWEAISGDLTDGPIFGDRFHTISTLDESPLVEGLLYVGTSDGNIWRTEDQGAKWWDLRISALPNRYVTAVVTSPTFPERVYVSFSGYRDNDNTPHLFRSDDRGNRWTPISANLPNLAINDVLVVPGTADSILFVATDAGVYGTISGGESWERLGANLPRVAVFDLEYHPTRRELIIGTYGQSMLTYDLGPILEGDPITNTNEVLIDDWMVSVFPNPAADWIQIRWTGSTTLRPSFFRLFNLQGRLVGQGRLESDRQKITISSLPRGIYVLTLENSREERLSLRVVKQ